MNYAAHKTVNLGAEWDENLRQAVREALIELGAKLARHDSGIGGSQELELLDVVIDGQPVRVESETYIGLSVSGPEEIIDRIQVIVSERVRKT